MKHTNKKGFTIVELVIVIAVIAILAAVLIPTFSNLIKKANISNDTAIAKNLNTAAISAQADTFAQAIEAAKEAGYLVAHLNAKAENVYFVWDDGTNQFLLYDLKAGKVLYSNTKEYSAAGENWYFTVNTKAEKDAVLAAFGETKVNCNYLVGDVAAVKDILAEGGYIYIDESLVLDDNNKLDITNGQSVVLELGSSSINTNGIIENNYPILVEGNKTKLTINGGIIGAAGSGVDVDGDTYTTPIVTDVGTYTKIDGTTFNINNGNGYLLFAGEVDIVNATVSSAGEGVHVTGSGKVTLEKVNINSSNAAIWACNLDYTDDTHTQVGHVGESLTTVISGTYEGGNSTYGVIVSCGGDLVIKGGTFISNGPELISFVDKTGSVSIQGGTFNMDPSAYVNAETHTVTANADGTWTGTAK